MIADHWIMTAAHVLRRNGETVSKDLIRVRDNY